MGRLILVIFCRRSFFFVLSLGFWPFHPVGDRAGASAKVYRQKRSTRRMWLEMPLWIFRGKSLCLLAGISRTNQKTMFFFSAIVPRWCTSIIVLVHQASQIVKPLFEGKPKMAVLLLTVPFWVFPCHMMCPLKPLFL